MPAFLPPIIPPQRRPDDLILRVEEATTAYDRRQFVSAGGPLYRGDRRWTPPLPHARADALGGARTTGFLGIAQNLGLGDETVGVIAARAVVHDAEDGAVGQWGLFDAINVSDLVERLFYRAETWLFENTRGIVALQGPAAMEPLTPAGMLVDGFDAWPAALLPYNPPYYPDLVAAEGYEPARTWRAWTLAIVGGARRSGPREPVDWRALREVDYPEEHAPGLNAWVAHLAGAQPFPAHPHLRWTLARAFSAAICARSDDGFCLGIPDFAPALRLTGGRLFPLGYALFAVALARSRRLRVFPAWPEEDRSAAKLGGLYHQLAAQAGEQGYRELVIAPIYDEDEESAEALSTLGAEARQRFANYDKTL
jgi:hypothetical protein